MDKKKLALATVLSVTTALNAVPSVTFANTEEVDKQEEIVNEPVLDDEVETTQEAQNEEADPSEIVQEQEPIVPLSQAPVTEFVAQIGDAQYATLQEALDAAKDGDTIQLSKNVTENLVLNKNVVLDGANKFTITTQGNSTISNGIVQNLTLKPENGKSKIYFGGKDATKMRLENVSIQYDVTTREYYTYTAAGNSAVVDFINVSFVNSPNNQGVEVAAPEWSYGIYIQDQSDAGRINFTACKFEGAFRTMISSASGSMNVENCSFTNSVYSVLNGPTTGAQAEATCVTTSSSANNHLVFTNNTFNNAGAIYVQTQIDFRKNHVIEDGLMHYIQAKASIGETIDFSDNTFDTGNNNYVVIDVPSAKVKMPTGMKVIDYWVWYETPLNVRPNDYSDYLYMYNEDGTITYVPQSDVALEQFIRQNKNNKQVTNQDTVLIEKELNLDNLEIAEDNILQIMVLEIGNLNLTGNMNIDGTLDVKGSGKLTFSKDSKLILDKTGIVDIDNTMKMENNGIIENNGSLVLPDDLIGTGEVIGNGQTNTYPQIQAQDIVLMVNDTFDPLDHVKAFDKEDGDIKNVEVIENTVDTTKPGAYKVTYKVTDSLGAYCIKTIQVTVNPKPVVIDEAPVIDAKDVTIKVGDSFDPRHGVTAMDKEDGDITHLMKIRSFVNPKKAGVYDVIYTVTDSQGATTTKTIKVTVEEKKQASTEQKNPNTSVRTNIGIVSSLAIISGSLAVFLKRKNKK